MIASAAITAMQMMVRRPMRLMRRAFSFLNRYFGLAFAERFPVEISVRTSFASLNSRRRAMFWRIAIPFFSSSSNSRVTRFPVFFRPRSCALAPFDGELRRGFWLKMRIFWL